LPKKSHSAESYCRTYRLFEIGKIRKRGNGADAAGRSENEVKGEQEEQEEQEGRFIQSQHRTSLRTRRTPSATSRK
jgi:hypothetical protein